MMETVFGREKDIFFMKEALVEAKKAQDIDEVPVGAVVVNDKGVIIARGYNSVERDCTQRSHAESIALEKAGKMKKDWRLDGCWIYVTLEPCLMCINLIKLSRLVGVVYGACSPLFGFQLDKAANLSVYKRDTFSIIEGVCDSESSELLKNFFKEKRKNSE
jgi:tRNA(adenine34) deaminase